MRTNDNNAYLVDNGEENNRAGTAQNGADDRRNIGGLSEDAARKREINNDRGRIRVLEAEVAPSRGESSGSEADYLVRREERERESQRLIEAVMYCLFCQCNYCIIGLSEILGWKLLN